ncbi:MAG: hypothetical protein ACN4E2_01315 [Nitrospinota bacterium]
MINKEKKIVKEDFGSIGIAPGACGLYAEIGDCHLDASLRATDTMQERGTFGAGVLLRGIYPRRANYYAFHVMYRNRKIATDLERLFEEGKLSVRLYGEMEPLVIPEAYRKYDLPVMRRYFVGPPTEDEMRLRAHTSNENAYIRRVVETFNDQYVGDARIFSSGKNLGVFITAMELKDTIEVFELNQYVDRPITAILIHMRWPTSIVESGIWWGAHPISILDTAIVHNGDLSSAPSNRLALRCADIKRSVGTDSEAILLELDNLITHHNFSYEEVEWIICQKFPKELSTLDDNTKAAYYKLVNDPLLNRYKMSGPSSFISLIGNKVIAGRDRDGLRQLWMGESEDKSRVIWSSEEKVIFQSAWMTGENFRASNCDPGKLIAYEFDSSNSISRVF